MIRYLTALLILFLFTCQATAENKLKTYITKRAHPSLPSPLRFISDFPQANLTTIASPGILIKGYILWIPGCFFTGVAFTSLLRHRELQLGEVYEIAGSCVVPILGGLAMRKLFELHPEWNALPLPPVWVKDFSIRSQS